MSIETTLKLELYHLTELTHSRFENYAVCIKTHVFPPISRRHIVRHNPYGPAMIICENNEIRWYYLNGVITSTQEFCTAHQLSEEDTFFYTLTYGEYLPTKLKDLHPNHNPLSLFNSITTIDYQLT